MILWVGKGIYLYRRHLPEDLGLKETTSRDFLPNSSPMNIIHRKKKKKHQSKCGDIKNQWHTNTNIISASYKHVINKN